VGEGVNESEEWVRESGNKCLGGDIDEDLSQAGSDQETVVNCDIEIIDAKTNHKPYKAGEENWGKEALSVEDKMMILLCFLHHSKLARHSGVATEQAGEGGGGGKGLFQLDLHHVTRIGDHRKLENRVNAAMEGKLCFMTGPGEVPGWGEVAMKSSVQSEDNSKAVPGGGGQTIHTRC